MSKAEAARANGEKSRGPTTEEGKTRSAQNSLQHGLNSHAVVLATESKEEYEELLSDYMRHYQPAGPIEQDLVHEIAAARWRLRRILRIETAAFDGAMERAAEENPETAESTAFETLTGNGKTLAMLNRYEGRLRRAYERAIVEIRRIQAERIVVQNEPTTVHAIPRAKQQHILPNEPQPATSGKGLSRNSSQSLPIAPHSLPGISAASGPASNTRGTF